MKPYPTNTLQLCDDDLNPTDMTVEMPTDEAFKNFFSYLEEDELAFYNALPVVEHLQIALSVNPFNALKHRMGK